MLSTKVNDGTVSYGNTIRLFSLSSAILESSHFFWLTSIDSCPPKFRQPTALLKVEDRPTNVQWEVHNSHLVATDFVEELLDTVKAACSRFFPILSLLDCWLCVPTEDTILAG